MTALKKRFAGRADVAGVIVIAAALTGAVFHSQAADPLYTIANNNSFVDINLGAQSPVGAVNWRVDSVDHLNLQWFWYRIGTTGPERSIDTISNPTIIPTPGHQLDVTYANSGLSVRVLYSLTGNNPGTGRSILGETITIINTLGYATNFHFFQYADFDLNGVTDGQSVTMSKAGPTWYKAVQTMGTRSITETVISGSQHVEAALYNETLAKLEDGSSTSFLDPASASGNVTFSFQWDLTLAAGASVQFSKTITLVPEPSALALAGLGVVAWVIGRRRRLV